MKKTHSKKLLSSDSWLLRAILFMLSDSAIIYLSYFFALYMRFDFSFGAIERPYLEGYFYSMPLWVVATIAVFYLLRLYHSVWSFVGIIELRNSIFAHAALVPVYTLVGVIIKLDMPLSYYFIGFMLSFFSTTALRFAYRFLRFLLNLLDLTKKDDTQAERLMVIGAGLAACSLINEMHKSPNLHTKVVCAIDDNPSKRGRFVAGVPIVGDRYDIVKTAAKYNVSKIVFAIPSCAADQRKAILEICKETGCKLQTIPAIHQILNDEVTVQQLRDVEIADLLGRDQIHVNNQESLERITGKVVLVTGGGGSIGSELCRQIARANPKKLIIFDIYENNAYEIQQELKRQYGDTLDLEVLIGSVRNTGRIEYVMEHYRPDVVFHAAAHKHVPLMEDSPNEAIKNNVFGTYKTAMAAEKSGVGTFVLISTDKAVNPTNVMGASKRLCEMVVQMMSRRSNNTRFVAVRFGNVLGSNGSVIPLFKKQIAAGGPVTITDKRIIRYFMTIAEAVSLVIQASHNAKGGEIFVLDMGEPVKIDDMARNLIRLSGFRPDVDIKIVYTGLRPGEKLYEELLMDEEGLQKTENELIYIGKSIAMDNEKFLADLERLNLESKKEDGDVRALISEMVPTYKPL